VFGFVYSGLDTGAAISPVLFGWLVDIGHAMWIFAFVSLFMVSAASTILLSQRLARQTPMQAREQPS
jgi:MFS family permease